MARGGAQSAVIEHLVAPAGDAVDLNEPQRSETGRPRARVFHGKPFSASRESVEILKERQLGDRYLSVVQFLDLTGNEWTYVVAAEQGCGRWTAHDVAGGSDGPPRRRPRKRSAGKTPRLEVFGQWGADVFYAAGRLSGTSELPPAVARLIVADGTEVMDDLEAGFALFIGRAGSPPSSVEILDRQGTVLARHAA